jgi:serine/threonine protein kinase
MTPPSDPARTQLAPSGAIAAAVPRMPEPGDRIAQYKLVKLLGTGGMGAVFQAIDGHLRRTVAIKVMRPEVAADPVSCGRFVREARASAAVAHDNVVTVYQVGEHAGTAFLAMQLLAGTSLAQFLAGRHGKPADPGRVVRIGREIAAGLAAAHALGLIHRDIKPSNVWLEAPAGRVKILDFGLAKPSAGAPAADPRALTEPGLVLGTPAYMAPEQATGRAVDHRADLFSLGVVLYELATGGNPFARRYPLETLTALAEHVPPPAADRNPEVPAELSELIDRLLAKDPAARPGTAAEVAAALRRIGRGDRTRRSAAELPSLPSAGDLGYEVIDAPSDVTDQVFVADLAARRRADRWRRWRPVGLVLLGLLAGLAAGFAAGRATAPAAAK